MHWRNKVCGSSTLLNTINFLVLIRSGQSHSQLTVQVRAGHRAGTASYRRRVDFPRGGIQWPLPCGNFPRYDYKLTCLSALIFAFVVTIVYLRIPLGLRIGPLHISQNSMGRYVSTAVRCTRI